MRMFLAVTVCLLLLTCGCDRSHSKDEAANQKKPPTASAPASVPASQPGRVTIDQSSVKALLLTYHQANVLGDWDALAQIGDPRIRPFDEAEAENMKCLTGICSLLKKKIGDPGNVIKNHPYLHFDLFSGKENRSELFMAVVGGNVDWSKVPIHEHGDSADIVFGEYTFTAKKIGGKWFGPIPPDCSDPSPIEYQNDKMLASLTDSACQELVALKFYKREIEAGLNDGTITKDNFGKKIKELDWLWTLQEMHHGSGEEADAALFVLLQDTPSLRDAGDSPRVISAVTEGLLKMMASDKEADSALFILLQDTPATAAAGDSPKVITAVADALSRMMAPGENHPDRAAMRAACQLLGRHPNTRSIPVLLGALDQTYVSPYYIDPANKSVRYEATWLDADDALRKITKASPVGRPSRQVKPTEPMRIKARQAWTKWWDANHPASAPAGR